MQIHLQLDLKGREPEADLSPVIPATTFLSQTLLKYSIPKASSCDSDGIWLLFYLGWESHKSTLQG